MTVPPGLRRIRTRFVRVRWAKRVIAGKATTRTRALSSPAASRYGDPVRRAPLADPIATACAVAATVFLAAFVGWPLVGILRASFAPEAGLGSGASLGEVLLELARDPFLWGRLGFTLAQAVASTVLTLLAALPAALLFARFDFRGKRLLRSLFTVPFVMPTVVAAIGFLALFGPQGLLGLDLRNSLAIVLIAHVFYNFAVVVRIVSGYLEAAAPSLRAAAATLGAGPWRTAWRVTLPLAVPAILAAATLVFLFCFTSFGVIVILAPAPSLATLEVSIYRLTERLLRLDAAAVLAMTQLGLMLVASHVYTRLQARLAVDLEDRAALPRPRRLATRAGLAAVFGASAVAVLSPLVALAISAFRRVDGTGWTLAHLGSLLEAPTGVATVSATVALRNSLLFAGASTVVALVVGFCFAYAVARGGHGWLDRLSLLPIATSAVTLGLGYLLVYPRLAAGPVGIVLAHALIGFPFVTRALLPSLRAVPRSLRDAASSLGAGPERRLLRIDLPLLRPAFVAAASFAFAVSMGEFGATLVLRRPAWSTLPVAIFDRLGRPGAANYGAALALALVLMVLTAVVIVIFERFGESEI